MTSDDESLWAHSRNRIGNRHLLEAHLRSTGALARQFAGPFGAGDLGSALGLLHDAGKASCAWQERLLKVEGTDQRVGINHKDLGARMLSVRAGKAAVAILGHHGGLTGQDDLRSVIKAGHSPADQETWQRLVRAVPEISSLIEGPSLVPAAWRDPLVFEMGLRLVFSALVDADHLDTAAHEQGLAAPAVAGPVDMAALLARFEAERAALLAGRAWSPVDEVRGELYEAAVQAALGPTGVYRLPAPTGAGKTMTAAGFGLHHAARHGKARVIVAVPFITITEQNAAVYRGLLGDDVVLEHHSAVEFDQRRARLGAENWDAPFVVTTTVQLFDSLFGRKPSRSRKLHRLANAVVVLDEVQALPAPLLLPILDGLRLLSQHFGTTVLLTSATQPSFQRLSVWSRLPLTEVVPKPQRIYQQLKRVRYEWRTDPRPTLDEVAQEAAGHQRALVVLNTIEQARRMFRLLPRSGERPLYHLSTRMFPAHRRAVLEEVRARLASGESVLLVSTSLIEAGVDVDFPAVFRAVAPADSLQQAAGRANREGLLSGPGLVVIFDAEDAAVPAFYRTAVRQTMLHFGRDKADPDDLTALDRYYTGLYATLNLERAERGTTIQRNRSKLDFPSVADGPVRDRGLVGSAGAGRDRALAFRMLDDDAVPVVVTGHTSCEVARDLVAALRSSTAGRDAFRAVQPYTVSLPAWAVDRPEVRALVAPVVGDLLEWRGDYDDNLGIDEGDTAQEMVW